MGKVQLMGLEALLKGQPGVQSLQEKWKVGPVQSLLLMLPNSFVSPPA